MTLATSKNLTVSGIAGIVALIAAAAVALFDGDPATNVDWSLLIIGVWNGVNAILAKGAKSTGGSVAQTEEAAARIMAAKGFARTGLLLALVAICSLPLLARAEDPAPVPGPKFGGCLEKHPGTCFAPAVSVNVIAVSLSSGDITSTFDPGLGYGGSLFSDKWYRAGFSVTASFPQYDGKRRIEPAGVFSFAEYARLGISCPLYVAGGFKENARLLLGFGADFGRW